MPGDASRARPLGRTHPLVGRVRLLARSPEERARQGLMLVEGVRLAEEALAEGARIEEALIGPRLDRDDRGRDALLSSMADAGTHQGVLLLVERPEARYGDLTPSGPAGAMVLVACAVQDPGNLGTLVRLTDAAGGTGLAAVSGADPFGPKAVRASAGSIFRLPVLREADAAALASILARLRGSGLTVAGAVPRGGADYREVDLSRPLALLVGGEGAGLPDRVSADLDLRLTIPMNPRVESINVAAAGAVLLFEAAARRRRSARAGD